MAVDFRINLARDLVRSVEERKRFYHGMLLYLCACAVLLVAVAYLSSVNLLQYLKNRQERRSLLATTEAVSGLGAPAFKNPERIHARVEEASLGIAALKGVLQRRVQLLPVVHNLFVDLPEGVALQSLSAGKDKMVFGLVMPPASAEAGDPGRQLRTGWEKNAELMERVASIRPVTGERRTMGDTSVFYVQFECVLK